MKYINKQTKNEPESLLKYRNTEPNSGFDGYDKTDLRKALIEEQGHICAYCMGEISLDINENSKPKTEIEHIKPRQKYKDIDKSLELNYFNMVAVCNGLSTSYPEKLECHHCDKTNVGEGKMNGMVDLKKLNPLRKDSSEDLVEYNLNGEILSKNKNSDVEHDLNVVLNLNNDALKQKRKTRIEVLKEKLKKDKPLQDWNRDFFDKYIQEYSETNDGKFIPYCMTLIWFLESLKSKGRYK